MTNISNKLLFLILIVFTTGITSYGQIIPEKLQNPPLEFSVMPFWFWNDSLTDQEIIRQIDDFEKHGVYGFVIHPRIGLPETIGWLSPEMIHFMRTAIGEAARRKMYVILYDEGMYPSGSSSGQVVAKNPGHAARGLAKIDLTAGDTLTLPERAKLITILKRPSGDRVAIIEKPSGGVIRGIHYIGEGSNRLREESPPAGDILNPDAVTSFIELVYDRYAKEFGSYFGTTVIGIFTDEPSPLGRGSARGLIPGNNELLDQVNRILGYDFRPFLDDLWFTDGKDWEKHRNDYNRAINICLEENYYKRLSEWCSGHGISLMGHPGGSMDIGTERYFQVPGQDLVWRYVEPGTKALNGQHSTMAKCASSAMVHLGYRRNANELYGAYGHNLTKEEMLWLANWCFVRGQNLLIPHAFFYSIRGPRYDERPPDVGPNSLWWPGYKSFADACRRLSWLNTESEQVCNVAILAEATYLPDKAAAECFRNQIDFNYLEERLLGVKAKISKDGVHIAGMVYNAVIIDSMPALSEEYLPYLLEMNKVHRLVVNGTSKFASRFSGAYQYYTPGELAAIVKKIAGTDLKLSPASQNLRSRHVVKDDINYYMLFNEENSETSVRISTPVKGNRLWYNPYSSETRMGTRDEVVKFNPWELKVLIINNK
jgi:hypothetical protein